MPYPPQAIQTSFQGIEVWISPDVPELSAGCNGFHVTAYEDAVIHAARNFEAALDRIEVHRGVLILVYRRHLGIACQFIGVPQGSRGEAPTIWERLSV